MRHGRAKAARKTLQYFERTVGLKRKPYYSVLLDATFLIAIARIATTSSTGSSIESSNSECEIVSRIERVLQVSGNPRTSFSRDDRLTNITGNRENRSSEGAQNHSNNDIQSHGGQNNHYNVRFFVPREAVDELELLIESLRKRSDKAKKRKKKKEYETKSKVFEDALKWITQNTITQKQKRIGSRMARCEILPPLKSVVSETLESNDSNHSGNFPEPKIITASEAVCRHIARDDGREDSDGNTISKPSDKVSRTYIVASQDENLLDDLRMLGTVPILRCTNNATVLILENPSKKGQRSEYQRETSKWKGSLQNPAEKALVDAAWQVQKSKNKEKLKSMLLEAPRGAHVKAKGPNPLSCKRKRLSEPRTKEVISKSKRRRQRAQRNNHTTEESKAQLKSE